MSKEEQYKLGGEKLYTKKGRIYDKDKLKEEFSKSIESYKDRTDLDIHPPPKLKWWQKLIGAFKGRRY